MSNMVTTERDLDTPESQLDVRALLLTQHSELIGELAQATANQFNNIMMGVTSYAEVELKKARPKDRYGLEQILIQATRATSLVQKLLAFSRDHASVPQKVELGTIVNENRELLREVLGEQPDLQITVEASPKIFADRIDIEQTLFSLVALARDAMEADGKLTISACPADVDREFIGPGSDAEPGSYVVLSVMHGAQKKVVPSDSPPSRQNRFRLSLVAIRRAVRTSHGFVRFSIGPSRSTFNLYFPVAGDNEPSQDNAANLPRNPAVARTILVVEDDDAVRVPAAEFLMMEGFKVLQARTGSEALHVVQQSRSHLDVLVTDIFMPKMNGHEVADALLQNHPNLKVLYISGDPGRQQRPHQAGTLPNVTLRKPFRLNMLRDKIHDLLGE